LSPEIYFQYSDLSELIRIIHNCCLVRLKYNLLTIYVMESFGIIEMLGWYVVGFSATILTLQIISKLNTLRRKEKRTVYLGSSHTMLK